MTFTAFYQDIPSFINLVAVTFFVIDSDILGERVAAY